MIRLPRDRRADRFVFVKTAIFFLGAGIWIAGVLIDDRRVTAVAIGLLALGIVLRLIPFGRTDSGPEEEEGEEEVRE